MYDNSEENDQNSVSKLVFQISRAVEGSFTFAEKKITAGKISVLHNKDIQKRTDEHYRICFSAEPRYFTSEY